MSTYLLIHGGSHGAWCWERLIKELTLLGHDAYALDLPGHGADTTPRKTVTRRTYRDAVCNYLESQNLSDVILVGHSLAGTVLPDIWENSNHRLKGMVFIAALILNQGEAPIDLIPQNRQPVYFELSAGSADNSFLIDADKARSLFFSDLADKEAEVFYSKLTPQPFGVHLDRSQKALMLPRDRVRYILCTADKSLPFDLCQQCAQKLGVEAELIEAGHDVMISQPAKLAQLLIAG